MPVSSKLSDDSGAMIIAVSGRFDFSVHREFRDAYLGDQSTGEFHVDLSGAEYMDSSALGMLLLLREYAEGRGAQVRIHSPSPEVQRILEIAHFDRLFHIEPQSAP